MRHKSYWALLAVLVFCSSTIFAQHKKTSANAGPAPDKAHLQKIWDAWSTLDPANAAQFYAQGPHTFFDIAPVKYTSWDEYQKGATQILSGFKSAKFTVNDDAELHSAGEYCWGTATIKSDMTTKSGKRDMATMRWTFVFGKQDGKWLLVHEHVSEPLQ